VITFEATSTARFICSNIIYNDDVITPTTNSKIVNYGRAEFYGNCPKIEPYGVHYVEVYWDNQPTSTVATYRTGVPFPQYKPPALFFLGGIVDGTYELNHITTTASERCYSQVEWSDGVIIKDTVKWIGTGGVTFAAKSDCGSTTVCTDQVKLLPDSTTEWNGPCFTFSDPYNVIKGGKLILWNSQFFSKFAGHPVFHNVVENPSGSTLIWGSAVFDGDNGGSFINAGNMTIGAENMQKEVGLIGGATITNKPGAIMVIIKLAFNTPVIAIECSTGSCGTIINQGTLYIEKCGSVDYGNVRIINEGEWIFSSLGFGAWPACPYIGAGIVTPGPYIELKSTGTLVVRAFSPAVVGSDENMDIIHYGLGGLISTCILGGKLHVEIQFPTSPTWTIKAGDEWNFWPFVNECYGGFSSVSWSGVGGVLPAGLSISLKVKENGLTSDGMDLYVVVCSSTNTSCNTLPKPVPTPQPGQSPNESSSAVLSFVLSWLLIICIFLEI